MYGVQMYFEFTVATALEGTNIAAVHNFSRTQFYLMIRHQMLQHIECILLEKLWYSKLN